MDDFGNWIDYSTDNDTFNQMLCSLDAYGFASGGSHFSDCAI